MILIIWTVLAALVVVGVFIFWIREDGWWGVALGFLISLIVAIIWGLGVLGIWGATVTNGAAFESKSVDSELRAFSVGDSIEGRSFFLGGGYVDGKRVLNYIVQRDGFSTIEQVNADESRVYEDETASPYVEVKTFSVEMWWLILGPVSTGTRYDFHIPDNSILENYTIDNG